MAKILIVEDDLPLLRLYTNALEAEHEVIAVESSAQAIYAIDHERPDLIVLDLNLPDAPGTTVIQHVDEQSDFPARRVVVMTGFAHYKKHNLSQVVYDVLDKPVTSSMLLRVVNAALASV